MTQGKTHKDRASELPNSPFLVALGQSSEDAKEADLANALLDLQEISEEADEEGMPPPSELAHTSLPL